MKHLLTIRNDLIAVYSQADISTKISQSMNRKYTCLCCSNALLRHISSKGVYWRCSHCYQEMPL